MRWLATSLNSTSTATLNCNTLHLKVSHKSRYLLLVVIYHSGRSTASTHVAQYQLCTVRGELVCAIISANGYNNNKLFNSSTIHHFVQQSLSCVYNYYQSKVTDGCMYWLFTWIKWTNTVTSSTTYSTTNNVTAIFCEGLDFLITQHTATLAHCSFYTPCSNRSSWPTNPDGMYQISREREKDQHSSGDWHQVPWFWSFPARGWKSTKGQSYSSRVCK